MAMVHVLDLLKLIFRDLSNLLEQLAMLHNSTLAINFELRNVLNKVISIINFAKTKKNQRYYDLIFEIHVGLKSLLHQGF